MPLVRQKKKEEAKAVRAGRAERARVATTEGEAEAAAVRLPPWRELLGAGPKEATASAAEAERPAGVAPLQAPPAAEQEAKPGRKDPLDQSASASERPAQEQAKVEAVEATPPSTLVVKEAARPPVVADGPVATPAPRVTGRTPPPILRRARPEADAPAVVERVPHVRALTATSRSSGLPSRVAALLGDPALAGSVRIHTDGAAARAAALLEAEAFTVGTHIYFAAGRYSPDTGAGQDLLAHELAHAAQHLAGAVTLTGPLSSPTDTVEREADRQAPTWRDLLARAAPAPGAPDVAHATPPGSAKAPPAAPSPDGPVLRRATDTSKAFLSQGYFQQAAGWGEAGASVDGALATDATDTAAAFPAPTATLGPETQPVAPAVAAAPALAVTGEIPVPGADTPLEVEGAADVGAAPATPHLGGLAPGPDGDTSAMEANFGQALDAVPTSLDAVSTSPGTPPPVALDGAADPAQAETQDAAAAAQVDELHHQAADAVQTGAGPEQVQPRSVRETVELPPAPEVVAEGFAPIPRMDELSASEVMTEEVKAATDAEAQEQLTAHLAETSSALDTAATDADAAREEKVADATTQNEALVTDAEAQQESAVADARGDIDAGRADTLAAQDEALANAEVDSEAERQQLETDVDARREADESAIEGEFAQAQTDAEAEKSKAEDAAEKEKADAERESEDESWWDAAVSAIADAFAALTSFINDLFDAAIGLIGDIIDAAKSFATDLINAARSFVIDALKAFGDVLKGLVTGLLGDIFPGLAAALNELIDAAVQLAVDAVNAIADALIAGVNALLDAIGGWLTAILEAYRAAINAALALAQAVLTGDWAALGKMILEAVLKLAGIPPADFYALIDQAMGALDTIIDDPGAFVGNVIDAVAAGFTKFSDNFLEHLQQGFFEWIVGPLGELGITLPSTWDIAGIFGLVMQVLGLTQAGIRSIIVEEFGETAGAIFDFVWRYVEALITGGLEGLWEQIKNDLSSLWDTVVDGIKNWLVETIVKQAVIRIATMFNPVGAILNAIMTVWNVYNFLRDNIQRIWGVVTSIVNMIASIAAGNIEPAANAVDAALASLIPIAISLLANLLGLGGITDKVREVLESVRETVRNAILSLIRRVRGMFSGGGATPSNGEAQGDADHEVGSTVAFQGGGSHRLWLAVSGVTVTPTVASETGPVTAKLAQWEGQLRDDPARLGEHRPEATRLLSDARGKLGDVQREGDQAAAAEQQAAPAAHPSPDAVAAADTADTEAEAAEATLAQVLGRLFELFGEEEADPRQTFATELAAMPVGAAAYAGEQLANLPPGVATTGWSAVKGWLEGRPGFTGFMGENSRVGQGPSGTAPILRSAVSARVASITGPVPPEDQEQIVRRAKPKIEAATAPYTAASAAFRVFIFSEAGRSGAESQTASALAGNNEDVALVTNDLRPQDQALIDQWDALVVPMQDRGDIVGNARGLRNQFEGMLRSSNGLKYVFASGFALQMRQVIASASKNPSPLHGVEVAVGERRADYTEWTADQLVTVVEVKNWNGQARWSPEDLQSRVQELVDQVTDHLGALRDSAGHPLGGVRVEIQGGKPPLLTSAEPGLHRTAAASPTIIAGRPKTLTI